MSWVDEHKGAGPWEFSSQGTKRGYENNPRFTDEPADTDEHHPCGYWVKCSGGRGYFFGEDEGIGEGPDRITSWPNSRAAADAMLSYASNYGVESFESIAHLTNGPFAVTFGGYIGATVAASSEVYDSTVGLAVNAGRFPIDGNKYLNTINVGTGIITFDSSISGFGMYMVDIGDFGGTIDAKILYDSGAEYKIPLPITAPNGGGWVSFVGLFDTDRTFKTVALEFSGAPGADFYGFDFVIAIKPSDIDQCISEAEQNEWLTN